MPSPELGVGHATARVHHPSRWAYGGHWQGGSKSFAVSRTAAPFAVTCWAARAEEQPSQIFSFLGLHLRHRLVCFGQNVDPNDWHFEWLPIV
jgi:hypothetical protein